MGGSEPSAVLYTLGHLPEDGICRQLWCYRREHYGRDRAERKAQLWNRADLRLFLRLSNLLRFFCLLAYRAWLCLALRY